MAELLLREGTLYLRDLLAAKVQYEQKAAVLMGAFITLAVGLAGAALLGREALRTFTENVLLLSAFGFGVSALFCMWALRDQVYGMAGINPRDWLTEFWMRSDSKDATTAKASAMMAEELQEDIKQTIDRNEQKADAISTGIYIGIVAAFATMGAVGWEMWAKP